MISQGGKNIVQQFVTKTKDLLLNNTITILQAQYGIWQDGHTIPVESLSTKDTDEIHVARMLRERLKHIINSLPETTANKDKAAVEQLVAEQAFTILNRFCALRMCEERELIFESIRNGYNSAGFTAYDSVTGGGAVGNLFTRYKWYIYSIFDELSVELPAVFDRFSPYCLIFPDETTLLALLDLINAENLTSFYDDQTGDTINFWKEDETIGWIYQYYNSLEERRKMREESNKPRNSREMAVRNQFFTPEYVVKFLTDNTLGRIWYEMTGGKSHIYECCQYLVHKEDEEIVNRELKEPTEIRTLDPTCGSMHFGLYAFGVYEYIYLDAWDNQPTLLTEFRYQYTREQFRKQIPALILEHNIYGCEIDPRALQMAALSLWLRAQRSYNEMGILREDRPIIRHSNLILAEPMPGNKKMLKILLNQFDAPMQRLINKIWEKMQYVGEAGLLIRMEKEIENEIAELRKNWFRYNKTKDISLFSTTQEADIAENEKLAKLQSVEAREAFFSQVTERLQEALKNLSEQLSADEGYENALFTEDATRGFAFIELCQMQFDVILMNPPFGEGSENTYGYITKNYSNWCRNLVCAFFIRMKEMLHANGKVGAIFDRTVYKKSQYEKFRIADLCGYIDKCADTGWYVLDANVETSVIVIDKDISDEDSMCIDVLNEQEKGRTILNEVALYNRGIVSDRIHIHRSKDFVYLPNSVIGYYFDDKVISIFKNPNMSESGYESKGGYKFFVDLYWRLFYEIEGSDHHFNVAGGGKFRLFYSTYRDMVEWENDGEKAKAIPNFRWTNPEYQKIPGVSYGERGDILDAQIMKQGFYFTQEYIGIPLNNKQSSFISLSYLNSVLAQYLINLYTGDHKMYGYINILPIPEHKKSVETIMKLIDNIISLKRRWYSYDETNLEYHGLVGSLGFTSAKDISSRIDEIQQYINNDLELYQAYVLKNDTIWEELANIEEGSDLQLKLAEYKNRRPNEELMSIDNASINNVLSKRNFAQEIIMNLVGIAFGRWDIKYVKDSSLIPDFGDVFDPLPFMPVVSLNKKPDNYPINFPADGILVGESNNPRNIVLHIREVMREIWNERADDIEFEICQLIGYDNLQEYFDSPQGFFDYHFKRYTKSRRKAPIYWPLTSANGLYTVWVYYPRMNQSTLPQIVLLLSSEIEEVRSELTAAQLKHDRVEENRLLALQSDLEDMISSLKKIIELPYRLNHDDGIPITAAPLAELFVHNLWKAECRNNLEELNDGDYDWSHLAFSMFPSRIRDKAKKDWSLALTHGLEEICVNKPKERKSRAEKSATDDSIEQPELF